MFEEFLVSSFRFEEFNCLRRSKVQLPAAFKGLIACGVQRFNCLWRSKVQLPAAFKSSIACGVQRFNCLWRSKVQLPAAFKGLKGFRFSFAELAALG